MEWFGEFLKLYFTGERKEAYKLKHRYIPTRLYKFMPHNELRIGSLLRNEIWFSNPSTFNDPYDCASVYWEEEELSNYLKEVLSSEILAKHSTSKIVSEAYNSLRDHTKISCFTEKLYNMPMWAHYANNHQGICVEYDFSQLDAEDDFSKQIFPVGYQEHRYDITNLIKLSFNDTLDMRIYLLYFLFLIKHQSWEYENEWRIILHSENKQSGLVKSPIKPTAVYFGLNCNEYESTFKALKEVFNCPMYKMTQSNSKMFELQLLEI
ncbi:DUF2971 domain-containing protein [Brevibacillus agri]|uniref:DUF2971 domain-containing protein n=1 Tax=Brevibacillus TaxID=55080 RepID=UPI001561C402|nr:MULTISPECIES: DUF2971 domain-containing protein [Brevibacillus]MBE5394535.1 DUF2971 domain-containing protein [Brevibacillus borstelensis]MED1646027.1 DUF2971 domain-containing protein [Brevibacillus agri]MED1656340.1 DUF2971 domain-containing protein [Brevibacillus agri]MED1689262.1 DUF2971 domain-containing protein [Brevibacillus agri]MED1693785.1 DUF2971 domain-containing protein [Brevibacillus agri]